MEGLSWSTVFRRYDPQSGIRQRYDELFREGLELLVGRQGVTQDLGVVPTMATWNDPWMKFVPPHYFQGWLLTVIRARDIGQVGEGSILTAKAIADPARDPWIVNIAPDCCAGICGVEIDGELLAVAWGGNHIACLNLADQSLVETAFDWAADDPIVGAVFTKGRMVVTTQSGVIYSLNPLQPQAIRHHKLGPNARDLVQVGEDLVQLCSPATLWVISQGDEPRSLQLEALKEDAERFTDRDGFVDGEILGAREVNGALLVELPHAYYRVDLRKGKIVSQRPKGDIRVARFDQMKMRFPYQPRSHLQLSQVSLLDEPVVPLFHNNELVVWLPSQQKPWKLHLDATCDVWNMWHGLTRSDEGFECVQLCRRCGRIRLFTFNENSPNVDLESCEFTESTHFIDLRTGTRIDFTE